LALLTTTGKPGNYIRPKYPAMKKAVVFGAGNIGRGFALDLGVESRNVIFTIAAALCYNYIVVKS
jgi:hypothetical protein